MRYVLKDGRLDRQAMLNDVWAGFEKQGWTPSYLLADDWRGEVINGVQTCRVGHLVPDDRHSRTIEGSGVRVSAGETPPRTSGTSAAPSSVSSSS